jgi:hypothetical protein
MFYEIISGNSLNYYMVKCNVNNVFSTEFISSPSKCLRLLYKGIFGIDDIETAKLAIKDLACLGDYGWRRDSRAHEVLALCDKYPIFCIPQLTAYIKNAYYLSPINLQAMNDKLDENIKALNNYYGVTDDASV